MRAMMPQLQFFALRLAAIRRPRIMYRNRFPFGQPGLPCSGCAGFCAASVGIPRFFRDFWGYFEPVIAHSFQLLPNFRSASGTFGLSAYSADTEREIAILSSRHSPCAVRLLRPRLGIV